MHRPTKRRAGRLRALTVACALGVSVVATALPASATPERLQPDDAVSQPVEQSSSWVWVRDAELTPSSWVWVRGGNGGTSTQSWVWVR